MVPAELEQEKEASPGELEQTGPTDNPPPGPDKPIFQQMPPRAKKPAKPIFQQF